MSKEMEKPTFRSRSGWVGTIVYLWIQFCGERQGQIVPSLTLNLRIVSDEKKMCHHSCDCPTLCDWLLILQALLIVLSLLVCCEGNIVQSSVNSFVLAVLFSNQILFCSQWQVCSHEAAQTVLGYIPAEQTPNRQATRVRAGCHRQCCHVGKGQNVLKK